jgi:hypothetical protein
MPSSVPRRFTLSDMMVLIGTIAIGLAPAPLTSGSWSRIGIPHAGRFLDTLMKFAAVVEPCALTLGLAIGLLRLKRPRPSRDRLFRQPGFVPIVVTAVYGLLAAIILTMLFIVDFVFGLEIHAFAHRSELFMVALFPPLYLFGFVVVAVWIALWISGVWRAERSWIDRVGRALGAYWVANSVLTVVIFYLFMV